VVAGAALAALAILVWRAAGLERVRNRLLLIDGRPVHWVGDLGFTVTSAGVLLEVRGDEVRQLPVPGQRPILDGVPATGGGMWLVDRSGTILLRGADGDLTELGRGPVDIPALGDAGHGLWVVRSPMQFSFTPDTAGAPFATRVSLTLQPESHSGPVVVPSNPFLSRLANAAHIVALPDGGAVAAPFLRDQVIRFDADGREVWRTVRGLRHETPDPVMSVERGGARPEVVVDYAPVNLALTVGPDGMLYVLSTVAARTDSSRLDALDIETGTVRSTRRFGTGLPTVSLGRGNIVRQVDAAGLRRRDVPAAERQPFAAFDLESTGPRNVSLEAQRGRITVVNIWASWCLPCREELPALDSLAASFDTGRVVIVALSDDVSRDAARRFLSDVSPAHLRIGFGGGNLKSRYRYLGLPATALVDAEGRLVRWWIGYAGTRQLAELASLIHAELGHTDTDAAVHRH
jgi:thiol-disulfide isomerase/thioredoxin